MSQGELPFEPDIYGDIAASIVSAWKRFCETDEGAELVALVVERARALKRVGHTHYSIDGIFHTVRYHRALTHPDEPFRVNNNHRAPAARMIMNAYPDLAGFFETRESAAA